MTGTSLNLAFHFCQTQEFLSVFLSCFCRPLLRLFLLSGVVLQCLVLVSGGSILKTHATVLTHIGQGSPFLPFLWPFSARRDPVLPRLSNSRSSAVRLQLAGQGTTRLWTSRCGSASQTGTSNRIWLRHNSVHSPVMESDTRTIGETLPTQAANKGPLARVNTHVDLQRT